MNHFTSAFRKLVCIAALTLSSTGFAMEVAGVKLDEIVHVAGQDLKLNGAGIRYKIIFQVYVIGLYLPERKSHAPDVIATPGARRLVIVPSRDISSEEFGRAFLAGINQNIDRAEKTKIIMQLMRFGEIFASIPELKKGDVLTTDWVPGIGTIIHHNGKKVADPLPDIAFYNALLKIWLGDKPADAKLKRAMLGERPEDQPRNY